MTATRPLVVAEVENRRRLASEVFHDLSQPLTALHCLLELSLRRDRTVKEFRDSVAIALQNAERLRHRLLCLRELSDAEDPGEISAPVQLDRLMLELQEETIPLFESAGRPLEVGFGPAEVRGNPTKLARAFFYMLSFLARHQREGAVPTIGWNRRDGRWVRILVSGLRPGSCPPPEEWTSDAGFELEVTGRAFRALGGEFGPAATCTGSPALLGVLPAYGTVAGLPASPSSAGIISSVSQ